MEKEKKLPVRLSQAFLLDLDEVFQYGLKFSAASKPRITKMKSGN